MKEILLKNGQTLLIRPAKPEDAAMKLEYLNILGGESDYLTFGEGEFNLTVEQEAKLIEVNNQAGQLMLGAFLGDKLVGNLNFHSVTRPRLRHRGEFGVSVLKEYWGLGIGTALLKTLIQWAEDGQVITKINLCVRSDHHAGIHLYEKFGFVREGLESRGLKINDRYHDFIHMGLQIRD